MDKVHIALGDHSYDIAIGHGLDVGALVRQALPERRDIMIVTNDIVAPLYLEKVQKQLEEHDFVCRSCILTDGESHKDMNSYMQIMTDLLSAGLGRDCVLLALGGGVVGDMTGFAAATYQRGVDFVQVPTTLLAMVDSSVGGKTAINHPAGKNMIGAFYQPKVVIADLDMLKTLPEREIAAGMAEVIKYGVILDQEFFDYLNRASGFAGLDQAYVVRRCCEWKAHVVSKDEKEHGMRALLNYGHTFGHAIEVGMGFGTWLHGEAVAVGMAIAAFVSYKTGKGMSEQQWLQIRDILPRYGLPQAVPAELTGADFIAHMRHDKKVKAGRINYVIPQCIGRSFVCNDLDDELIIDLINQYSSLT